MQKLLRIIRSDTFKGLFPSYVLSFLLFYPSLFNFFTHDDFFHFKIAQVNNISEFLGFFNLFASPFSWGFYRPLTTQVFYSLGSEVFSKNPFWMHVASFIVFGGVIYLVYKLLFILFANKYLAFLSSLLYATSASHFGHLYFLGAFQELGLGLSFLSSLFFFVKFLKIGKRFSLFLSLSLFAASLASKETAVVLPLVLILVSIYLILSKKTKISFLRIAKFISPYLLILAVYLYLRIFHYGFATGESYIWSFSPRIFNTLFWYTLWSFNLPEMLVDYVGPGFKINPNLLLFWQKEVTRILVAVLIAASCLIYLVCKSLKNFKRQDYFIFALGFLWFGATLVPVIFLPWHKFTFYLTLPLVGIAFAVANLLMFYKNNLFIILFFLSFLFTSFFTLDLTVKTHWITRGAAISRRVYDYFSLVGKKNDDKFLIEFYNTDYDADLPWKPSDLVSDSISGNNFFEVFFKDNFRLADGENYGDPVRKTLKVRARDFLGY